MGTWALGLGARVYILGHVRGPVVMTSIYLHALWLLFSLSVLCAPLSAWAWNGTLEGGLSVNQTTSSAPSGQVARVMGAGRVSYEDGLSLIGTIQTAQREGLSQLSIRVNPEHFNQTLSLPGEGRLVTYQERDRSGALTFSASAYQGWLEVREVDGYATVRFELSVKMGDEVRSLYSGGEQGLSLRSLEGAIEADDVVDSEGELIVGVIDEGADQGCDESSDDVYETGDDTGCDEGTDDWSEEAEPWDDATSEESSSSDGCEEDEWAAEASVPHTRRARRGASPVFKLLVRLAPLWCSLLFIRLWRRRTLRLRVP